MHKRTTIFILFLLLISSTFIFYRYSLKTETSIEKEEENKKETDENLTTDKDNLDKKEESEKNNNQEETDDLPWVSTWKGAITSLMLACLLTSFTAGCCMPNSGKPGENKTKEDMENARKKETYISILVLFLNLFFYYLIFLPLIFAIQKYKDKSYWKRLELIIKNFFVLILVAVVFFIIAAISYGAQKK